MFGVMTLRVQLLRFTAISQSALTPARHTAHRHTEGSSSLLAGRAQPRLYHTWSLPSMFSTDKKSCVNLGKTKLSDKLPAGWTLTKNGALKENDSASIPPLVVLFTDTRQGFGGFRLCVRKDVGKYCARGWRSYVLSGCAQDLASKKWFC